MDNIQKILKAIRKINPKAKLNIVGDDLSTCEINWVDTTPISKQDIQAQIPIVEQELKDAEANKKQAEQSAINKLKALGLTDAEVEAFRK